jgi:cell division protein FtsQ
MTKIINPQEMPTDIKYINGLSYALICLFALLMIGNLVQYLVKNKINNLNGVVIKGNVTHNNISSIRNQLHSNVHGNFYSLDLLKAKQAFESINWVNQAVVKRVYPNHIEVKLSEFKPKAIWGIREDLKLVDDSGIIFEASADDEEYDQMPQFIGSEGQSKVLLDMYKDLVISFAPLHNKLKVLELNARGSWIATLEGGIQIELGRGSATDVIGRAQKFASGVDQLLAKLNKKASDIEYIDLRHTDSYAMRMHGMTTLDLTAANASIKK